MGWHTLDVLSFLPGPDQGRVFDTSVLAIAFDPGDPQAILIGGADSGSVQGYDAKLDPLHVVGFESP